MFKYNESGDAEHIEIARKPACLYAQILAFYDN